MGLPEREHVMALRQDVAELGDEVRQVSKLVARLDPRRMEYGPLSRQEYRDVRRAQAVGALAMGATLVMHDQDGEAHHVRVVGIELRPGGEGWYVQVREDLEAGRRRLERRRATAASLGVEWTEEG